MPRLAIIIALGVIVLFMAGVSAGILVGRHLLAVPETADCGAEPSPGSPPEQPPESAVPLEPPDPILEPYYQLWQALTVVPDSLSVLADLARSPTGAGYQARLALARCPELEPTERIFWYEQALDLYSDPAVQAEFAETLAATGSISRALTEAERALPLSAAISLLIRLSDPVPAAKTLSGRGLHDAVLEVLTDETGPEADLYRARALIARGRPEEARGLLLNTIDAHPTDALMFELARACERTGRPEEALHWYGRLGPAGEYGRARILLSLGRTSEAIEAYLASNDPEARWRGALLVETRGDPERALTEYERLAAGTSRLADDAAFRAWVVADRLGLPERAEQAIALLPPTSHWRIEAGREVVTPDRYHAQPSSPPGVTTARALIDRLGMRAGLELGQVEVAIAANQGTIPERLACGQWYIEQSLYHQAVRLGIPILRQERSIEAYRLAYPLAYEELVLEAAAEYGVDPLLILSVMREESHYHPTIVSWAGAVGLMQIMPGTGQWIASALNEEYSIAKLTDPGTSIRWGAWYLAHLIDRWDGDVNRALASYNGGEGNVARWVQGPLYREPRDLFAVLAFQETREYVTKVNNTLVMYRWLYGDER